MSGKLQGVAVGANPFSVRAVLTMVLAGAVLFVALLWMIGSGLRDTNDGQAHAGGKGLNGYAAMVAYLERRGFAMDEARGTRGLSQPGLLVLTPPSVIDGKELNKIVEARRYVGPTLIILPKWQALPPALDQRPKARDGWVRLGWGGALEWPGFLDELSLSVAEVPQSQAGWKGAGLSGALPDGSVVMSGAGVGVVRIVSSQSEGLTLAGFMDDGGAYPGLEQIAQDRVLHSGRDGKRFPLVLVFEPDLLNNYGMARFENAQLAEALVRAAGIKAGDAVVFDMTLVGHGRSASLLTLAFTPPFLAVTLCLLLAAVAIGWRAFMRFGPPLSTDHAIALGKHALVSNAAGLVLRTRRLHLLGPPYAERARERVIAALALPRTLDGAAADAAIDRALASRDPDSEPFSVIVARLRAARRSHDLLKAARDLHVLERKLTR